MSTPQSPTEELSALFPEALEVAIAGETMQVREMPLRKIARFAQLLAPLLAKRGDADLFALLSAAGAEVIAGVAHAIDRPRAWVAALSPHDFERLVRALHDANRIFFEQRVRAPRIRRHGDTDERELAPWGWPDSINLLLEHGHRDPGSYTLRQVELYLTAIGRAEHARRRSHMTDTRAATITDGDGFDRVMRQFDNALNRAATREQSTRSQ